MRLPSLFLLLLPACADKAGECDQITEYYEDRDGDGFGNPDEVQRACELPEGFLENADDCDDRDPDVYPGAAEVCGDGELNDCASTVEEAAAACAVAGEMAADAASFTTIAVAPGGGLGTDVANAGDIDRDGVDDVLLGAPGDGTAGADAGAAWVYYGGRDGALDEGDAAAVLTGEEAGDLAGSSVGTPGDINGDGDGDLLIAAPGADDGAGRVYLVLQDLDEDLPLSEADGVLVGDSAGLGAGYRVRGVGDFNGDDELDFAISSPTADAGAGRVWLVTSIPDGEVSLGDVDRQLLGILEEDGAGTDLLGGDLDGDGDMDLLVGAPLASQGIDTEDLHRNGGIFGMLETFVEPTSLEDSDTKLYGDVEGDLVGSALASLRDVDGDGYEDFGISAPSQGFGGPDRGSVYVIPGPIGIHSFEVVGSVAVARLDGESDDDLLGTDVAGPGDVDGDGVNDVVVSVTGEGTGGEGAGAVYTVFGPISGSAGISMDEGANIGGASAIQYLGVEAGAALGTAIDGAGDHNGDGASELIAGAPGTSSGAGAVYLLRAAGY